MRSFLAAAMTLISAAAVAADDARACSSSPDVIGPCFQVHGRLAEYNGNPAARIWRIGTKRVLGIQYALVNGQYDEGSFMMPKALNKRLGDDIFIFADFDVCPLSKDAPGEMQFICIESAKNIYLQDRRPLNGKPHIQITHIPDIETAVKK